MFVRIGKRNVFLFSFFRCLQNHFGFVFDLQQVTNCGLFTLTGCVSASWFPFRFLFYFHRSICFDHVYSYARCYDMCGICIYSLEDRGHENSLCMEWIGINTFEKDNPCAAHAFPSSQFLSTVFVFGVHVSDDNNKTTSKAAPGNRIHKHTQTHKI